MLSEATEQQLVRDALYALQGIDGRYIKYDADAQVQFFRT